MLPIIGSCLLALCAAIAVVGYGSGLARFAQIRPNLGDRGVLGLLGVALIGCTLHFVVALSTPVQLAVLACGVTTAIGFWREIRRHASLSLVGVLGLFVFVLVHPQALHNYDDGLYYLQTFRWNRELPVTIGIGNLHGRLAFNSALFLIAPLTDRIEIGWITNLLAVTFVMLSLCARVWRMDVRDRRRGLQYWFVMTLLLSTFVLRPGFLSWLGILMSDSVAAVLIVYWFALALELSHSDDRRTVFAMLVFSAVLATSVKISAAPLILLSVALIWLNHRDGFTRPSRVYAVAAVFLTLWMGRGILLSGCAVYPVRQTCFSRLPWAVPVQEVDDESLAIRSWARRPNEPVSGRVLQDWSWLPPWIDRVRKEIWVQALLFGLVAGALAIASGRPKLGWQPRSDLTVVAGGLAGCLVMWFWSAPDVRFGAGFILSAALLGISVAAAVWLHRPRCYVYAPQILLSLMLVSGLFGVFFVRRQSFFYALPQSPMYELRSSRGVGLWVPRTGDQCWAHELPCTPYVHPAALLGVRWPAPWRYHYEEQPGMLRGGTPVVH